MTRRESSIVLDVIEMSDRYVAVYNPDAQPYRDPPGILHTDPDPTLSAVPREMQDGWRWASWGKNDRWPTDTRKKIAAVPMAGSAIEKLVKMLYGNGIAYYRKAELNDGNPRVRRAFIPKVEEWLTRNQINPEYLPNQFNDARWNWNSFCEMIFSEDKRRITNIFHKESEYCRISEQDPRALRSLYMLYSMDFSMTSPAESSRIARVPLFQWDMEDTFLKAMPGYKMAWHIRMVGAGIYYAEPFWLGLLRPNGWIDAAVRVPEVVNAMMRNQITLKYQVLIPESYFRIRHTDWNVYTDDQRNKIIDDKISEFNEALKGEKNAFMSVSTVFREGDVPGTTLGKIEIIAIDDKIKKDAWVPSSEVSDAQIVQGLGLHPSQQGLSPQGGKMGAGSGSDQRETYNLGITLNNIEQQRILAPLNWIARYNARFDPDWNIQFFIDHTHHTTVNDQEDGMKPSQTTLKIQ